MGFSGSKSQTFPGLRYCPPGYFCPEGTGARNENPCPAGTYTDDVQGLISIEQCRPCPEGHYCPFRGTVFAVPCTPGVAASARIDPVIRMSFEE